MGPSRIPAPGADVVSGLYVPEIPVGASTVDAAQLYAAAGWYVLPIVAGSKNPGSLLGKGWPAKTSRDPRVIAGWFGDPDDVVPALALHVGRSGAVAFDVDTPANVPAVLGAAFEQSQAPHQSTRTNVAGRGHYVFTTAVPIGHVAPELGQGWGDIRGANGIVVVAPSVHQKAAQGGRYAWISGGVVPGVPPALAGLLRPPGLFAGAAAPGEVAELMAGLDDGAEPCDAVARVDVAVPDAGRHEWVLPVQLRLLRLAAQGHHGIGAVLDDMRAEFVAAVAGDREGGDAEAEREWEHALNDGAGKILADAAPRPTADPCEIDDTWGALLPKTTAAPVDTLPSTVGVALVVPPAPPPVQKRRVVLERAADIPMRAVRWLWDGRIALGTLGLIGGREGVGKSTVAYTLIALLTRGGVCRVCILKRLSR